MMREALGRGEQELRVPHPQLPGSQVHLLPPSPEVKAVLRAGAPALEAEVGLTRFGATNPPGNTTPGVKAPMVQGKEAGKAELHAPEVSCKSQAPCHNRLLQTGSVLSPAGGRAARPPHLPFLFHLLAFPAPVPCIVSPLHLQLRCGRLQRHRVSQHSLQHPPPGPLLSPGRRQRSCSPSRMLLPPLRLAAALQGSAPRQHVPQAGGCPVPSCSSQQSPRGSGIQLRRGEKPRIRTDLAGAPFPHLPLPPLSQEEGLPCQAPLFPADRQRLRLPRELAGCTDRQLISGTCPSIYRATWQGQRTIAAQPNASSLPGAHCAGVLPTPHRAQS